MKKIRIIINGVDVPATEGETIFEVANRAKIEIPTLCEHPDFPHKANCRVCVVEVTGQKKLMTSCSTAAVDGMEITTNSPRVKKARDLNLEMLFAEHVEKCATCVWRFECKLLHYAEKYHIKINTFKDRKYPRKTYKFANAVELDGSQCIDCRNCIDACSIQQGINYLQAKGKGHNQEICPTDKKGVECILCGQCAVHCPVSAAQEQYDYQEVEKIIKEGDLRQDGTGKIVVALFAPSILLSLCEDFSMNYGKLSGEQLSGALRRLGFKHVFDLRDGHSIVSKLVANDIDGSTKPIIGSDCPSLARYIEFYKPELVENLSTVRSAHIISGGLIKLQWALEKKYNPRDVIVVSIGPCTARKYEISRSELMLPNGQRPVDHVLTTRELSFMLKKNKIALNDASGGAIDLLFENGSVCDPFFGGSGAMLDKSKIKKATGMSEIYDNISQLSGISYLEALACPGGCFGGGGEPIPTTGKIIESRKNAAKKNASVRVTNIHKNDKFIAWLEKSEKELGDKFFRTKFYKRS